MTSDGDLVSAPASGEEFGQVFDRGPCDALEGLAPETREEEILGVGCFIKVHGVNEAESAIVISDQLQGQGLRTHLLELLLDAPFQRHQHVNRFRTNPGGLLVGLQFQAFQAHGVSDDRYRAE
jgi:hypothetical protein